jgi:hypothetical protein
MEFFEHLLECYTGAQLRILNSTKSGTEVAHSSKPRDINISAPQEYNLIRFRQETTFLPREQKVQSCRKEHPTLMADATGNQERHPTAFSPHPLTFLPFRRALLRWGSLPSVPGAVQQSEQTEMLQLREEASQQLQRLQLPKLEQQKRRKQHSGEHDPGGRTIPFTLAMPARTHAAVTPAVAANADVAK